jgi:GT2 family glycosyltransferase
MEWGHRARAAGFQFKYVPEMIVFHPARPSLRSLCIQWDRQIQHALTMHRDAPFWRLRWTLRSLTVACSPFAHVIQIITAAEIQASARIKAIPILFLIRYYRAWRMITLLRPSDRGVIWNRDEAIRG